MLYKLVPATHIPRAIDIEQSGFPPDEAGSLESFSFRQSQAPTLFLGAYDNDQLIAYVCSTLSSDESITHASMSTHVPDGRSVCIHSVCVDKSFQRRGVALSLLKEYIARLQSANLYDRALLIAHEELLSLYEKAGFTLVGKSPVTHGSRPWFEMKFDFKPQQLPAVILEVLQASSQNRTEPRKLASFQNGIDDLVDGTNYTDILCPRCSSIILLKGIASLEERPSVQVRHLFQISFRFTYL